MTKTINHSMHGFFETLADAVRVFRSSSSVIPGANCRGCKVTVGKSKKRGKVLFEFMSKNEKAVMVEIDVVAMSRSPKAYIDDLLEQLNDQWYELTSTTQIFLPKQSKIVTAIKAVH